MLSVKDRFEEKILLIPFNECWEWGGNKYPNGYGRFTIKSKGRLAHRISYGLYTGEIPDGLVLDHLCRNKGCVNPKHLEPVTSRENLLRSEITMASMARKKTHCYKGHEFSKENTSKYSNGSRRCKQCQRDWFHANKSRLAK